MGDVERRLGRRIAELRQAAKFTQAGLAEKVGVAPETVSRLERGVAIPSIARLAEIAAALDLDLAEIFRVPPKATQRDRALDKLNAILRRRTAEEIETIIFVAEKVVLRLRGDRQRE